jgi:hypothetical protein
MATSNEQLPKVKLMAVATLSGISAEPILMFPDAPVSADMKQWGKTSVYPSQNIDPGLMPPAQQRHEAHVSEALQSITPSIARQHEMVAQAEHLQSIARGQTNAPAQSQALQAEHTPPVKHQEREREQHER